MALEESELKLFMETVNMFRIDRLYKEEPKNVAFLIIQIMPIETKQTKTKTLFKDSKKDILDLKPGVHSFDNCEYKITTNEYLRIMQLMLYQLYKDQVSV